MIRRHTLPVPALLAALFLAAPATVPAQDQEIEVLNLDEIVQQDQLEPDGPPARVITTTRAGDSELQVLVMREIRLHHHDQEDHVVYVARGSGTAQLEAENGQLETRPVETGDILNLPRGRKHAFDSNGDEELVLLVVATAGWKPLEDTVFHE